LDVVFAARRAADRRDTAAADAIGLFDTALAAGAGPAARPPAVQTRLLLVPHRVATGVGGAASRRADAGLAVSVGAAALADRTLRASATAVLIRLLTVANA